MKVALIARRALTNGGISQYVYEVAVHLAQKGCQVTLFANEVEPGIQKQKGITWKRVPMLSMRFLEKRRQLAWAKVFQLWSFSFISRFMVDPAKFDIIHTNGDSFIPCHLRNAQSCHLYWLKLRDGDNYRKNYFNPLHLAFLSLDAFNYQRQSPPPLVSACSPNTAREIAANYPLMPKANIRSTPNGVNIDRFNLEGKACATKSIRERHNIPLTAFVLIFVGWEYKRKGLRYVIEALSLLPEKKDIYILVVGGDKEAPYRALAQKKQVADRVVFAGAVNNGVEEYFKASDLFVFPTRYEPFGLVVTEAAACGLPVLIPRSVGAADFIMKDQKCGFYIEQDSADIAEKIKLLFEDKELYRSMSQQAYNKSRKFTWEYVTDKVLLLYNEITTSRK